MNDVGCGTGSLTEGWCCMPVTSVLRVLIIHVRRRSSGWWVADGARYGVALPGR